MGLWGRTLTVIWYPSTVPLKISFMSPWAKARLLVKRHTMTMKAISDDPINTCFIGGIDYSKVCGGPGRDRTYDLSIMSRLL